MRDGDETAATQLRAILKAGGVSISHQLFYVGESIVIRLGIRISTSDLLYRLLFRIA